MLQTVFVSGSAGFIGFHIAQSLLSDGYHVVGYDAFSDYYDVSLKRARHQLLQKHEKFYGYEARLEDDDTLAAAFEKHKPNDVIHLAAQAGVRHSLENPHAYIQSNVVGTFNILECARSHSVKHFMMASTSSIYGDCGTHAFKESEKSDYPLTMYAATKKADEAIVHSYSHLHDIPSTILRFFTVYGPWGRPDMALFKFVENITKDRPIDVYNGGDLKRDFTYIDDVTRAVRLLMDCVPEIADKNKFSDTSLSPVAPFRTINIGNGTP
ncbi:MAG: NAD-dependent epimerase/dehydratase family protein, partial [Pseudomonadota bacterium]